MAEEVSNSLSVQGTFKTKVSKLENKNFELKLKICL